MYVTAKKETINFFLYVISHDTGVFFEHLLEYFGMAKPP